MSEYKATDKYTFVPSTNGRLMIKVEQDAALLNEAHRHFKENSKNSSAEIVRGSGYTLLDATTGKEYLLALTEETERPNPNYAETLISITPQILVLEDGKVSDVQYDGFDVLGIKKEYLPNVKSKTLYTSEGVYSGIDSTEYARKLNSESIAIATQDKKMALESMAVIINTKMPDVRYKLRGQEVHNQAIEKSLESIHHDHWNDPKSMPADKARELFLLTFKPEVFSTHFGVIQSPENAATKHNGGYLSISEAGGFVEMGDVERKTMIGRPSVSDKPILEHLAGDDMLVDAKAVKVKGSENHVLVYTVVDNDEKNWVRAAKITDGNQLSSLSSDDAFKEVGINPHAFKQGETYYTAVALNPPKAGNKLAVKNARLLSQTSPNELRKNISLTQLRDHKSAAGIEVLDRYAQLHAGEGGTNELASFNEAAKGKLQILHVGNVNSLNQASVEMLYRHYLTPEFHFLNDELDVYGSVIIENTQKIEIDGSSVAASLATTAQYRTKPGVDQENRYDWGLMHFSENGQMVKAENQITNPLIKDAFMIAMPDERMEDGGLNGYRVRELISRTPEDYGIKQEANTVLQEGKLSVVNNIAKAHQPEVGLSGNEVATPARKNKM